MKGHYAHEAVAFRTKGAAVATSDYGEVLYMFTGGETRITTIGNMNAEFAYTDG